MKRGSDGRPERGGRRLLQLVETDEVVDFGNLFGELFPVLLHHAARHDDAVDLPRFLPRDLAEDRLDGLLLRRVDEAARVHDDDARLLGIREGQPLPLQMPQHHLGIDEVLRASQRHDAHGREQWRKRAFHEESKRVRTPHASPTGPESTPKDTKSFVIRATRWRIRSVVRSARIALDLIFTAAAVSLTGSVKAAQPDQPRTAHEVRIAVGHSNLYAREIGSGPPIIVLHGGPDFDSRYLLPDMDRMADAFRLIYYDQRGRGRSGEGVRPEDVTLASDIADLDKVREHFQLRSVALLGHSWGTVLALEYAIRHPELVSRLILMNPAPVTIEDFKVFRKERLGKLGADLERLRAVQASAAYKEGDPDAVTAYYRIHFKAALRRQEDLEKVLASLRASFSPESVLKARAVEDRLMKDTWLSDDYDLLPKLAALNIPTLVIYSDHDFIPAATSTHIVRAMQNSRLVTLKKCGHFAYLECPLAVRKAIDGFFRRTNETRSARHP